MLNRYKVEVPDSVLVKQQNKVYLHRGDDIVVEATVRWDDKCGNGHNSFSIVADVYDREHMSPCEPCMRSANGKRLWLGACGCCHDIVRKYLPELAKYIKWHLVGSDMPLHYVENVTYLAGDKDCWGLAKGEVSEKSGHIGEGKERELDGAREAAVWPDATDEQLSVPKDELKQALLDRLPALMKEFKADVEELGFVY